MHSRSNKADELYRKNCKHCKRELDRDCKGAINKLIEVFGRSTESEEEEEEEEKKRVP